MPGPTSNSRPVLIAAVSGRALAAAAQRAGLRPLVADMFCDLDTVELAERAVRVPGELEGDLQADGLIEALQALLAGEEPEALVCGSGFEEHPEVLDELARHFPLAGCRGETVRRINDPFHLAAECHAIGIPFPEITLARPSDPEGWLAKRVGGSGGLHVRPAAGVEAGEGTYFQRRIEGGNVSALFVADREGASIVGFSAQWTSPSPKAPHRYGGAVRLTDISLEAGERIGQWLSELSRRNGLLGLCSADFKLRDGVWTLLEINPRPGATLDIFDSADAPLLAAHIAACRGERAPLPAFRDSMAAMVVYADGEIASFPRMDWPDWLADRQPPGTRIRAGEPVCTIFADGDTAEDARMELTRREARLKEMWSITTSEKGGRK